MSETLELQVNTAGAWTTVVRVYSEGELPLMNKALAMLIVIDPRAEWRIFNPVDGESMRGGLWLRRMTEMGLR